MRQRAKEKGEERESVVQAANANANPIHVYRVIGELYVCMCLYTVTSPKRISIKFSIEVKTSEMTAGEGGERLVIQEVRTHKDEHL